MLITTHEAELHQKNLTFLMPNPHEISTHYVILRGIPTSLSPTHASKELKVILNRSWEGSCLDVKVVGDYRELAVLGK
jgi:hypothetical protein